MKKVVNFVIAAVLASVLAIPAAAIAQPQDRDDQAAPKAGAHAKRQGGETHPVIRHAIRQLETVKNELATKAASDFGGHKAEAIKSIDQAIEHLNQALAFDKK